LRRLHAVAGATVALASAAAGAHAAAPAPGPELDLDRLTPTGAVGDQAVVAAAHDGRSFLVVWRSLLWNGEVRAARVGVGGPVEPAGGVPLPGLEGQGPLAVAAGAQDFLLVAVGEPNQLQAVRLGGGDRTIAPASTLLVEVPREDALAEPAVARQGAGFLVAWSRVGTGAGVYVTRVSGEGRALDPSPLRLSSAPGSVALAWDGQQTFAAWSQLEPGGERQVLVARWADGDPISAAPGTPALRLPAGGPLRLALAAGGGQLLVAAAAPAAAGTAVTAARLDPAGRALDAAPLRLGTAPGMPTGGPAVAWDGARFLVVWDAPAEAVDPPRPHLVARAVSPDGTLDAPVAPLADRWGEQPALAAGPGGLHLFFSRAATGSTPGEPVDLDVAGAALSAQGQAGEPFLVSTGPGWQGAPALAAAGDRVLAVWEDRRIDRGRGDLHAVAFDASGAPPPPGLPLAAGPGAQRAPAVAWDGHRFLVVWHDGARGLQAASLARDGALLEPPAPVPGTADQRALADPVLCADAGGTVLVWGRLPALPTAASRPAELRALILPPGAPLARGAPYLLASTHDEGQSPQLRLSCGSDSALLAWSGLHETPRRIDLHLLRLPRAGDAPVPAPTLLERGAALEPPAVASNGRHVLLVWRRLQANGARTAVVATRIDSAGRALDSPPLDLGAVNAGQRLAALWDGQQYLLLGIQAQDIHRVQLAGRRLSADGRLADRDWFSIAPLSSRRGTGTLGDAVAVAPGQVLVAYEQFAGDDTTANQRVRARLLTLPALGVDEAVPVNRAAGAGAGAPTGTPASDAGTDGPTARPASGASCHCVHGRAPTPPLPAATWLLLSLACRAAWRRRQPSGPPDQSKVAPRPGASSRIAAGEPPTSDERPPGNGARSLGAPGQTITAS
jgi:hypothetical protein